MRPRIISAVLFALLGITAAHPSPVLAVPVLSAANPAPMPSLDDFSELDIKEIFVIGIIEFRVTSIIGGIGVTDPLFFELPDRPYRARVLNIWGDVESFDPTGAPLDPGTLDVSGLLVADDFDFGPFPFAPFDFGAHTSATFRDSLIGEEVTLSAADSTIAFALRTDEFMNYQVMLQVSGAGVSIGSIIRVIDVQVVTPWPSSLAMLLFSTGIGLVARNRWRAAKKGG